jgi:hypothetical protein
MRAALTKQLALDCAFNFQLGETFPISYTVGNTWFIAQDDVGTMQNAVVSALGGKIRTYDCPS